MHSKSDNIKTIMNNDADESINEPFDSLKNRYQNYLELMKCSRLPSIIFISCITNSIR